MNPQPPSNTFKSNSLPNRSVIWSGLWRRTVVAGWLSLCALSASAALVTYTNNDASGTSSFSGIGATNWDSGQAPAAGNDYVVSGKTLRSPTNGLPAAKYIFAGDSLTFGQSCQFLIKGSNTLTINSLILSNNTSGLINGNASTAPDTARVAANIFVKTNGYINASATNRYINFAGSVFSGAGGLIIGGTSGGVGTIYLSGAHSYTGAVTITGHYVDMDGTTVMTPSALIVGKDSGWLLTTNPGTGTFFTNCVQTTNIVRAGGNLNVGSGPSGDLRVAWRTSANDSNIVLAALDVSAQNQFKANVGNFLVGYNTAGAAGSAAGFVYLATNNVILATNVVISDSPNTASALASQVVLGRGSNVLDSPILIVGGRKQRGTLTLPAGGTLLLTNSVTGRMDLTVGGNLFSTGVTPSLDLMDLTGGPVSASLGNLVVAQKSGGLSAGVTATLTLATNVGNAINVNEVTVGSMTGNASGTAPAVGTLSLNGGLHKVNNNITLAAWDLVAGTATGTLNLNAANLTVLGGIANGGGTSTLTLNSSTLSVGGDLANTNTAGTCTLTCNNSSIAVAGNIDRGAGSMTVNLNSGLIDLQPSGDATPGNVSANTVVLNGTLTNVANITASNVTGTSGARNQTGTTTVSGNLNPGTSSTAGTLTFGSLTLNATATLRMNLTNDTTVGGGANDLLDIAGDLDLGGATLTIGQLAGGFAVGTYRLANVTGTINNNFGSYPATIGRYNLNLQIDNSSSPRHLDLVVTGTAYSLHWGGELSPAWDTTTQNWTNQLNSPDLFNDSDNVRFDDNSANQSVTLDITAQPGQVVFSNNATTYTLSGAGNISGAASLTKDGTGTLTLSTSNDFSGAVAINAGKVVAGALSALGGASGGVAIASGATLDVNDKSFSNKIIHVQGVGTDGTGAIINSDTLNGLGARTATRNVVLDGDTTFGGPSRWDIRGTGVTNSGSFTGNYTLTKVGPAGVYLTDGINVNMGDILVGEGSLVIESSTILNTNASIVVSNATSLAFYRLANPMGRPVILEDGATLKSTDATATNQNQVSGSVTINGVATISASGNATNYLHLSGPVTGPGVFVKTSANTVELDNPNNNWTGGTLVSSGTLQVGNGTLDGNLPDYPLTNNATVNYASSTTRTLTAPIANAGTWNMLGAGSLTNNGPIIGPGTWNMLGAGSLTMNGPITGAGNLNVRSNGNLTINGPIDTTAGVTKYGEGILTLANSNSFAGTFVAGSGGPTATGTSGGIIRLLNPYGFGGDPSITKTVTVVRAEVRLEGGVTIATNIYLQTAANSAVTSAGAGLNAIRNMAGTNTVPNTVEFIGGAGNCEFRSDAGLLVFDGPIFLSFISSRSLIFSGAGNGLVNGVLSNQSTNALTLEKSGTGIWTLAAPNLYTGPTLVKGGTLLVNASIGGSGVSVQATGTLGGSGTISSPTTFNSSSHAVLTLGSPLTFGDALIITNAGVIPDVHLNLSNNVPVGTYPLATYNTAGSSGAFATNPVVDSGSLAAGTQGAISTSGGTVTLTVTVSAPATPPGFVPGAVSVLPGGGISLVSTGAIGGTYRLWASTNLALTPFTNYATLLHSGTVGTSPFTNLDLTATNYPQRFYLFTTP